MRKILPLAFALASIALSAQDGRKAAACFWGNDFELGIPLDWEITQVERQTSTGVGLGEFVPAFTLGDAADANAGGYFPVPDLPIGNQFIMANDDATPCNCDMDDVSLTTGPIDLTGRTGLALEFRAFHEMTLGAGDAIVEASTNGTDWEYLDTLDAVSGAWQDVFISLSAYDNAPFFKLRFRWSDGGGWASGFALDDLCLRERLTTDLSVIGVRFGNDTADVFTSGDQLLRYTRLPLEQAGPTILSVTVMNRGTASVQNIGATAQLDLGGNAQGSFNTANTITLGPGEHGLLVINTGYIANANGILDASIQLTHDGTDEDPTDNTGAAQMRITGPGWDDGYGAMACDDGTVQGSVGSDLGFIAANRMEIINEGSEAFGISAVLGTNSAIGEEVRAILMDHNFAMVDTSTRHTITQEDIDAAWGGAPLYLALSTTPTLAAGDYYVGMQRLGTDGYVSIATSGTGATGRSALMVGGNFDITWSTATPMVRLHLNVYEVGVDEMNRSTPSSLGIYPVPAQDNVSLRFELDHAAPVVMRVLDMLGQQERIENYGNLPVGNHTRQMDVSDLPSGAYMVRLETPQGSSERRFLVVR